MTKIKVLPQDFKDRIIFIPMYNEIDWTQEKMMTYADEIRHVYPHMPEIFLTGSWTFLGSGDEEKWCGVLCYKSKRKWNYAAEIMMLEFAESGGPVFRCTSPLSRKNIEM